MADNEKSLWSVIFSNDSDSFAGQLWRNQILPRIKDTTEDVLNMTIHHIIFGDEAVPMARTRGNAGISKYHTNSLVNSTLNSKRTVTIYSNDPYYDVETNIIHVPNNGRYEAKEQRERIYEAICEQMEIYGRVTVADIFRFCGKTQKSTWNYNEIGWTDLTSIIIPGGATQGPEGRMEYIIYMPKPIKIKIN